MDDPQNGGGEPLPDIKYTFDIVDAGDVRHMLLSAAGVCDRSDIDQVYVHSVLTEQADMVTKGLHVRNMEDVPDMMGDIVKFHQLFGLEYAGKPRMLPQGLFDFRRKFMQEEIDEYAEHQPLLASAVKRSDQRDISFHLEQQLDGLVDEAYVVLGTAYLQFGAKVFNEAWRRVHEANMKKVRAEADEDARSHRDTAFDVVKPEGWVPPNHRDLVEQNEHIIYRQGGTVNPGHERDTRVI